MTNDINEVMDTLDAAVFSGDTFLNKDNLKSLKDCLKRWNAQVEMLELTENNITNHFVSAIQADFPILKVDNVEANFWNIEEDEDQDDEEDYILLFGFENYTLIFKESNISNVENIGLNSWKVTFTEDGKEKTSIFKFYS